MTMIPNFRVMVLLLGASATSLLGCGSTNQPPPDVPNSVETTPASDIPVGPKTPDATPSAAPTPPEPMPSAAPGPAIVPAPAPPPPKL